MGLRIHCTQCRRDVSAARVSTQERVAGREQIVWANRCTLCGAVYVAPDPSRDPARTSSRRHDRQLRELERAGQLPLFPGGRR